MADISDLGGPSGVFQSLRDETTILVVEDDDLLRELLQVLLENSGYRVAAAANGKEALTQIACHAPRLMITDLIMPELEGIELVQIVRKQFPGIRIIAISGAFEGRFLTSAKLLGAHAILPKPVDPSTLLATVTAQLRRSAGVSRNLATELAGHMNRKPIDILLVEDNPADVRLLREAFRDIPLPPHRLIVKSDGQQALDYLYANLPNKAPEADLVLLDLNLPKKDGREVLKILKADSALAHIPVIVLSTSSAPRDIQTAYQLHANCYIRKSADIDEMWERLRIIESFWLRVVTLPTLFESMDA